MDVCQCLVSSSGQLEYDLRSDRTLHRLLMSVFCFFFQAEDGIRDLVRSRGLGDVYKRQSMPVV